MNEFIKLKEKCKDDNIGSTLYLNLDSIIAIHKERGIVYVANSGGQDVFVLTEESIDHLLTIVEREAQVYEL